MLLYLATPAPNNGLPHCLKPSPAPAGGGSVRLLTKLICNGTSANMPVWALVR